VQSIKNLVHVLLTPLMLGVLFAAAAALFRLLGHRRIARAAAITAVAVVYLGSTALVGDALSGSLERRAPPLDTARSLEGVNYVVVLGSGYAPTDHVPVTGALDEDGLVRLAEGVSIYRRLVNARLVVSGGAPAGGTPSAFGYAQLACDLGVDSQTIDILDKPLDTDEEAQAIRRLIGGLPFVLVTTATHMPRAVRLMRKSGLNPIPAPTGQTAGIPPNAGWRQFLPTSSAMRKTERALHEYAGLAVLDSPLP
jgi:uncharacterized SAM-binding protein YcdF (DUF218 family)